jgi:hypothetical protein
MMKVAMMKIVGGPTLATLVVVLAGSAIERTVAAAAPRPSAAAPANPPATTGQGAPSSNQPPESLAPREDLTVYPAGFADPGTAAYSRDVAEGLDRGIQNLLLESRTENDPEVLKLRREKAQAIKQAEVMSKKETALRHALDASIKDLDLRQQPLETVINQLRDQTGATIRVNWTALKAAGIDRTTAVAIHIRDKPLRNALSAILSLPQLGGTKLDYCVEDGVISVTTREQLESPKYQVVHVYDVRDLLVAGEEMAPASRASAPAATQNTEILTEDHLIKRLIDTVQSTVAPRSWRNKGGQIGSIREINGQLVVNQTTANQRAIYRLLQHLRESRVPRHPH